MHNLITPHIYPTFQQTYPAQLMIMLNSIEKIRHRRDRRAVCRHHLCIEICVIGRDKLCFWFAMRSQYINNSTHVVVALESPGARIASGSEESHSTSPVL